MCFLFVLENLSLNFPLLPFDIVSPIQHGQIQNYTDRNDFVDSLHHDNLVTFSDMME